ncbi:MAG TPA: hypothetical protein VHX63_17640 [Acidobacteriaceae bacterium]|jgi:hypothetical protein|nr:hypothetical protein [Acidobacteriaceae bacterium]
MMKRQLLVFAIAASFSMAPAVLAQQSTPSTTDQTQTLGHGGLVAQSKTVSHGNSKKHTTTVKAKSTKKTKAKPKAKTTNRSTGAARTANSN